MENMIVLIRIVVKMMGSLQSLNFAINLICPSLPSDGFATLHQ